MKQRIWIYAATLGLSLLTACNDKDFCDRPHPHTGEASVTTDWKGDNPPSERIKLLLTGPNGITTATGHAANEAYALTDRPPGTYRAFAYNDTERVRIEGNAARLQREEGTLLPQPGLLYYGHTDFRIESDGNTDAVLVMKPQTRLLEVRLNLSGEQPERVATLEGVLTGIADTRILEGLPTPDANASPPSATSRAETDSSRPGSVPLRFDRTGSELRAAYRLLGIDTGRRQILTLTLTYQNGKQESQSYELTPQFVGFNEEGFNPAFGITASFVLTPPEPEEPDQLLTPGFRIIGWGDPIREEGDADMDL